MAGSCPSVKTVKRKRGKEGRKEEGGRRKKEGESKEEER